MSKNMDRPQEPASDNSDCCLAMEELMTALA